MPLVTLARHLRRDPLISVLFPAFTGSYPASFRTRHTKLVFRRWRSQDADQWVLAFNLASAEGVNKK